MPDLPPLPPPRHPGSYRIALVCLGNICRSPMADVVLSAHVADAGLDGAVTVVSAGTGGWHAGEPMDRRAAALLTAEGYDASRHRAQQVRASWLDEFDLVLAMDLDNLHDLRSLARGASAADPTRVRLFRDFDPDDAAGEGGSSAGGTAVGRDLEVPDPYYGGDQGFRTVLAMVDRTSTALTTALSALLP